MAPNPVLIQVAVPELPVFCERRPNELCCFGVIDLALQGFRVDDFFVVLIEKIHSRTRVALEFVAVLSQIVDDADQLSLLSQAYLLGETTRSRRHAEQVFLDGLRRTI